MYQGLILRQIFVLVIIEDIWNKFSNIEKIRWSWFAFVETILLLRNQILSWKYNGPWKANSKAKETSASNGSLISTIPWWGWLGFTTRVSLDNFWMSHYKSLLREIVVLKFILDMYIGFLDLIYVRTLLQVVFWLLLQPLAFYFYKGFV